MKAVTTIPLGLLLSQVALADESATLHFAWPDGATWRVVEVWSAEAVSGGDATEMSGVVRGPWTWSTAGDGGTLTASPSLVRATPRGEPRVLEVSAALEAGFVVRLPPEPMAEAVPEPVLAPADAMEDAGEEGGAAETPVMPAPATPEPAAEAAVTPVAPMGPTLVGAPDVAQLVAGGMDRLLDRVFVDFDGQTVPLGRDLPVNASIVDPRTGQAMVLDVTRRVDALPICPGTGPGPTCVQITITASSPGAPDDVAALAPGQRRDVAVWTVETGTLVPHGATVTTNLVYQMVKDDGTIAPVALTVQRDLHFLPEDVPAPLPGEG